MTRSLLLAVLLTALAACGNLPRPFQHEGDDEPLLSTRAMRPISIQTDQPGLAQALVGALEKEDIASTTGAGGDRFLILKGQAEGLYLHWTLTYPKGEPIGDFKQPMPAKAEETAAKIASLLRADDLGGKDLAARPKVTIDKVAVNSALDPELLKRALMVEIERLGIAVVEGEAPLHVSGNVRITPGLAGHDLVEVTWVVNDDKGKELGKVNQGNPINHDELLSKAMIMTHQIAAGAAEGVRQIVQSTLKK